MPTFRFHPGRGLRTGRLFAVLPLLAVLLASAASAQSAPLVPHTGSSLAYRIGFPGGWKVGREDLSATRDVQVAAGRITNTVRVEVRGEQLSATRGAALITLVTTDLLPIKNPAVPTSWAEQRRIMTASVMGSDSLLFGLLANAARRLGPGFTNAVREMRTLGGQRAGYMSGLHSVRGDEARMECYVTVSDGVMYFMFFADADSRFAAQEPLFARVRDSLVFASAPVSLPGQSAPAPSP